MGKARRDGAGKGRGMGKRSEKGVGGRAVLTADDDGENEKGESGSR